jgi:hypothetical protein
MTRRESLALLLCALASCREAAQPTQAAAPLPASTLKLDPLVALVPAAALVWLVELRPSDIWHDRVLGPAVATIVKPERLEAFARHSGGVDLREMRALVVAGYDGTTLALARTTTQPARVEAAFAARALSVEGRAVDGGVTRCWGIVRGDREELALLGGEGVGLERGHAGPLQAAVYFAQGRLRRALPALSADPLARGAALAGDAPVRAFAPGPFTGEWGRGLGGLLRAATAVAVVIRPVARADRTPERSDRQGTDAIDARLIVTGAWGDEAPLAAQRLAAAFRVLADDPLGQLLRINHPLEEPRLSADRDAVQLGLVLDSEALAKGLHAATDAKIAEIMALS